LRGYRNVGSPLIYRERLNNKSSYCKELEMGDIEGGREQILIYTNIKYKAVP